MYSHTFTIIIYLGRSKQKPLDVMVTIRNQFIIKISSYLPNRTQSWTTSFVWPCL